MLFFSFSTFPIRYQNTYCSSTLSFFITYLNGVADKKIKYHEKVFFKKTICIYPIRDSRILLTGLFG